MSTHYHCPKCRKYFAERAPHPDCDCPEAQLEAQHYVSQDELPTTWDHVHCWLQLILYVLLSLLCYQVNHWLGFVPLICSLANGLCLRSTVRFYKSIGIFLE